MTAINPLTGLRRLKLVSFTRVASALIGLLFVASAVGKLIHPDPTFAVMRTVWNIDLPAMRVLFVILCSLEATLAAALLVAYNPRLTLAVTAAFVTFLTVSLLRQYFGDSELPCGCGLSSGVAGRDYATGIARNVGIILTCILARPQAPNFTPHVAA